MKRLSDHNAILQQGLVIVIVFIVDISLILMLYLRDFEMEGIMFFLLINSVFGLFIYNCFLYANISYDEDNIQVEKLFSLYVKPLKQIDQINESLRPLSFYILFFDGAKVHFYYTSGLIKRRFIDSNSSEVVKDIKTKLGLNKNAVA